MGYLGRALILAVLLCCAHRGQCQLGRQMIQNDGAVEVQYPYYMQSPIVIPVEIKPTNATRTIHSDNSGPLQQRSSIPGLRIVSQNGGRSMSNEVEEANSTFPVQQSNGAVNGCLYDKSYFDKLDECLARKPYPTVGLPAFKNEDLLVKRGLGEKQGCVFVLNNGLFKSFQIIKYSMDSDSQCLDGNKVSFALGLNNVTLSYLWTLRCLNRADQLLDDATLEGKTTLANDESSSGGICVGSSQSFGFTSLQLSSMEAQVDLSTDVFKNWRVTNVTVAMASPSLASVARSTSESEVGGEPASLLATNIKEYVFESLDGDELNWRYLHLFQNWSRNRLHTNFLDQYRRFLWISLQRCLSESSAQLPTKLKDVFINQKYN